MLGEESSMKESGGKFKVRHIVKLPVSDELIRKSLIRIMENETKSLDAELKGAEPHIFSDDFEKKMEEIIGVRKTETSADKLKSALEKVMDEEEAELEKEMAGVEPHVFSEAFEKKMEKLLQDETPKQTSGQKLQKTTQYAAVLIIIGLLIGGIVFCTSDHASASKIGVEIREWLENAFTVEEGDTTRKDEGVLFEESQIGYLPEGFEKVYEDEAFSHVMYKYQNDTGDYIILNVWRDKIESGIDNDEIGQGIGLNADGLEYRFLIKQETDGNILTWTDTEDAFYIVNSTLDKEEMIKIMDGISY